MALQRPMAVAVSAQCSHLQTALSFRSRTPTTQSLSLLRRRPSSRHQQQRTSTVVAVFKSRTAKATTTKQKKKQPRVEDGIFGTSGGIGFTKENELFVGRVTMLGFAVSLLGEAVTGKGILAQLNLETGIPITEAEPLLLFFILFTLLGAIGALGDRGRFVDDATGLERAVIPPGRGFRAALGLSEGGPLFGFTKANELFVGRLAQLGIAFSLIGEIVTGKGALAQLNVKTGVPVN